MISNAQKALIHVAKNAIGMTEDEYRAMLSGFGVSSSTELNRPKFDAIMRHFKKMGFRKKQTSAGKTLKDQAEGAVPCPEPETPASAKDRLKFKVQAMAKQMHLSRAYLDAIARHMFGVDTWFWLDADQMRRLVAALGYQQRRNAKKAAAEGGR